MCQKCVCEIDMLLWELLCWCDPSVSSMCDRQRDVTRCSWNRGGRSNEDAFPAMTKSLVTTAALHTASTQPAFLSLMSSNCNIIKCNHVGLVFISAGEDVLKS